MARFDVFRMPGGGPGYLLDVQADLLAHLATRAVVPLLPSQQAPRPIADLNPVFEIVDQPHVLVTQAIAGIPAKELRQAVGSLAHRHDDVMRALDTLLVGF